MAARTPGERRAGKSKKDGAEAETIYIIIIYGKN